MKTPDDTYNALKRTDFHKLTEMILALDPYGSYTFNCMNADKKWRVQSSYNYVVVREGWTVEEFNEALHHHYSNR
jgi:hypothetical protein